MRRALFLALLLIPLACGDDHPSRPPAVDPPELGSISLSDFAVVGDTLAVTVEADRADTLLLLVDDAVVAAATEAPFTFRVSTVAFANGLRWMSARAVNVGGEDEQLVPFLLDRLQGGVAVVVLPLSVKVDVGASEQFTARVLGTPVKQVIWSVAQDALVPYPGVDVGTIDVSGVYTAPPEFAPGLVVMVRASSALEPAAHGEAHVELQPAVAIEIVSSPAEIVTGRAYDFGARIYGTTDSRLTWSVVGGEDRGTISFDGHYVAPTVLPSLPSVTIRAASMADTAKTAEVTLDMREPYRITVSPDSAVVSAGGVHQFQAEVFDAPSPDVLWSVVGGPAYGTVTAKGLYTAPLVLPTPAQARVRAHCAADTIEAHDALVDLVQGPPADEAALLTLLTGTGRTVMRISNQLVGMAGTAALTATRLNNGVHTLTGRLTEAPGEYRYAASDDGWLTVVPRSGPTWSIRYLRFETMDWRSSSDWWMEGFQFQGELDCLLASGGYETHVVNSSRAASDWQKPTNVCKATEFERTLSGTFAILDGDVLTCGLSHRGKTIECSNGIETDETIAGTAGIGGMNLALDERYEANEGGSWDAPPWTGWRLWTVSLNSTGVFRDREFTMQGMRTSGHYFLESWYHGGWTDWTQHWLAEGKLLKNGEPYGTVLFTGPVVTGVAGPDAVLDYSFGQRVTVKTPGIADWMKREFENPFNLTN
jgi:hypothetical protein